MSNKVSATTTKVIIGVVLIAASMVLSAVQSALGNLTGMVESALGAPAAQQATTQQVLWGIGIAGLFFIASAANSVRLQYLYGDEPEPIDVGRGYDKVWGGRN